MRTVSEVAGEIVSAWIDEQSSRRGPRPGYLVTAWPYLEAMLRMKSPTEQYGMEDGEMVILYFLDNAQYWRGERAKALKTELKQMLKEAKNVR